MKGLYAECLSLGVEVDSPDAVYVFAESVLYLLGATGAFAFQTHIRKYCTTCSAKTFRLRLCEHRYTNLDVKLYTLHIAKFGTTPYMAKKSAEKYKISHRDARLIYMLLTSNDWFKKTVKAFIRTECKFSEDMLSYRSIHAQFDAVYPSVLKYIKHIAYKKLRFLVDSENGTLSDFHSELSIKLVQSFYSKVPVQLSEAHLINYLKRSAHNHAINIIKSGTTQKRGRMTSTEPDAEGKRKYNRLCLSQNQMALTPEGELQDVDGTDSSVNVFEDRFSISEVLDSLKLSSRKYRFLSLLLGVEDKPFTQWLRESGKCTKGEDNVDVQHALSSTEYTKLISEFLRVPKANVDTFFESLKQHMAW